MYFNLKIKINCIYFELFVKSSPTEMLRGYLNTAAKSFPYKIITLARMISPNQRVRSF